jgi:hypothetical protein
MIAFLLQAAALASMVVVPALPRLAFRERYHGRHWYGEATGSSAQCGRVLL